MTCTDATAHRLAAPPTVARPAVPARPLQAPHELTVRPLAIRHETDRHGRRVAIVSGVGVDAVAHALDLRSWAGQLAAAADAIDAPA